jgi:thiamine monophosphate synthase
LKRAVANARIPVLAIGGITPARAAAAIQTGAAGIAAIGLFLPEGRAPGALGLRAAVRELRAVLPRAASDR